MKKTYRDFYIMKVNKEIQDCYNESGSLNDSTSHLEELIELKEKLVNKKPLTDLESYFGYNYIRLMEKEIAYEELQTLVEKLFQSMDENTTSLWRDDLECTHECIVIEDVDDGVKMDDNDNPIKPCYGSVILHLMDKINKEHLNDKL
tara:strand:- start:1898 stop:2338 length:441 start_codon:yes stop_codon:yes gene_type:complete